MTCCNRNSFLALIHSNKYDVRQRKSDAADLLQKQPEKRCCYCDIFSTLYQRRCIFMLEDIKALNSSFILSGNKIYQMTSVRRKDRKQISFFSRRYFNAYAMDVVIYYREICTAIQILCFSIYAFHILSISAFS